MIDDVRPDTAGSSKTLPLPTNRSFGLTVGGILIAIAVLRTAWTGALFTGALGPIWWPVLTVGAVLVVLALVAPRTLGSANRGWMAFGLLLNRIVAPLVMGLVFFLVLVPTAIVMRWRGHDPLGLRPSSRADSYWHHRGDDRAGGAAPTMEQQF